MSQVLHGVLFGHGHMGQLHASKIASRSDVTLDIIDPKQGLTTKTTEQPDFAIVATPTFAHADIALPLLKSGVPCLVEKPLTNNIKHAEMMAKHPHLSVGHIERYNPVFQVIDNAKPEYIEAERLAKNKGRSQDIDVIGDLMIHDLDLLLKYMPGTISDVRAKGVGIMGSLPDLVNARIEITMHTGRTGVANLTASRVSSVDMRTWRLFEPGRYWSLDLKNQTGKAIAWPDTPLPVSIDAADPLTAEHDAFFDAVRGHHPFPCNGHEALQALHLAERIRQCLR